MSSDRSVWSVAPGMPQPLGDCGRPFSRLPSVLLGVTKLCFSKSLSVEIKKGNPNVLCAYCVSAQEDALVLGRCTHFGVINTHVLGLIFGTLPSPAVGN